MDETRPPKEQSNLKENALEPIAVIGMSLKFPKDADSEETFWNMLMEKRCALSEFPPDRLNSRAFHHPDLSRQSTVNIPPYEIITSAEMFSIDVNDTWSLFERESRRFRCLILLHVTT